MSKELINNFTDHLVAGGKSNSTVIAYKKDLEQLSELSTRDMRELNAEDIMQVLKQLQKKYGFTPKTVSRKINSFRTFYRYLVGMGHVASNPADSVSHPKITARPQRILSPMEFLALREVSRNNHRLYTMIELMLQTGLRIGEVSRLKVGHLDLTNTPSTLHIERFSTIPERKIQLTEKAVELVKEYLPKLGAADTAHPLFPTRDGKHIIIRNIRSSVDRAMSKAGIKDASVNDLRNTFIVVQLAAGVPIDVISHTVGHRSKNTTMKYLELLEEKYQPNGESKLMSV